MPNDPVELELTARFEWLRLEEFRRDPYGRFGELAVKREARDAVRPPAWVCGELSGVGWTFGTQRAGAVLQPLALGLEPLDLVLVFADLLAICGVAGFAGRAEFPNRPSLRRHYRPWRRRRERRQRRAVLGELHTFVGLVLGPERIIPGIMDALGHGGNIGSAGCAIVVTATHSLLEVGFTLMAANNETVRAPQAQQE